MKIDIKIKGKNYTVHKIRIKDLYFMSDNKILENLESRILLISQLTLCPVEDLRTLKIFEIEAIEAAVNKMIADTGSGIPFFVELGDYKLGLLHFEDITVGEFADLEIIMTDLNFGKRIHEFLSILYRPVLGTVGSVYTIEKYDYKKCKERADLFLDFELESMKAVTDYFFAFAKECLRATAGSLANKMLKKEDFPEEIAEEMMLLQASLKELLEAGTQPSLGWQEKTFSELMRQANSISQKLLISYPGVMTKRKELQKNTKSN